MQPDAGQPATSEDGDGPVGSLMDQSDGVADQVPRPATPDRQQGHDRGGGELAAARRRLGGDDPTPDEGHDVHRASLPLTNPPASAPSYREAVTGRVVLVATPIGNLGDLSPRAVATLSQADLICCEDTRHTRTLLSAAGVHGVKLVAVHAHNEATMSASIVTRAERGETVAVVSDAGLPGISDPGERVVRAAADAGVPVEVIPGPSASLAALVVSGLATGRFCFEGFLPRQGGPRRARLGELGIETRTMILYESPHHLVRTVEDLVSVLGPDRAVSLIRELTKIHEEVWRGSLAGAIDRVRQGEQRGEWVIVVAGAPVDETGDDEIRAALAARLEAGEKAKTAVAAVTAELGVARRRVYTQALVLRQEKAEPGS